MSEAPMRSVLIVEDSDSQAAAFRAYLERDGTTVDRVSSGEEALNYLACKLPQALLLDLELPGMKGMDVLNHVVREGLPVPVIVVTDHSSTDVLVQAMKSGAFDFLTKPFRADRLRVTLQNAIRQEELSGLVDSYKEFERERFHGFIGASAQMQALYRIIENVSSSKASVFIKGESGTGKELCAEAIHRESPRHGGPFIPVNCAAIPRELMESEIFGHVKGAFTGAVRARDGAATQADGGTLFLDEVCEMDMDLQSKLLRFIQTGTFQKVGDSKPTTVDVRFVCATNKDPLVEIAKGRFREDLYYRLHVIPVSLPPLRERDDDQLLIARNFLKRYSAEEGKDFASFTREAEAVLASYSWPGNIRELQNLIRHTVVLNKGDEVTPQMLPSPLAEMAAAIRAGQPQELADQSESAQRVVPAESGDSDLIRPLWEVERDTIERAISLCEDNIPKAAALLGISASTIYRKRKSWGIE